MSTLNLPWYASKQGNNLNLYDIVEEGTGRTVAQSLDPEVAKLIINAVHSRAPCLELIQEFGHVWSEHPEFIRAAWMNEVNGGDTNLGYWEWVLHQIEATP